MSPLVVLAALVATSGDSLAVHRICEHDAQGVERRCIDVYGVHTLYGIPSLDWPTGHELGADGDPRNPFHQVK